MFYRETLLQIRSRLFVAGCFLRYVGSEGSARIDVRPVEILRGVILVSTNKVRALMVGLCERVSGRRVLFSFLIREPRRNCCRGRVERCNKGICEAHPFGPLRVERCGGRYVGVLADRPRCGIFRIRRRLKL